MLKSRVATVLLTSVRALEKVTEGLRGCLESAWHNGAAALDMALGKPARQLLSSSGKLGPVIENYKALHSGKY